MVSPFWRGNLVLLLLAALPPVSARADAAQATITVDIAREEGPVNRGVFSQAVEAADTANIFSPGAPTLVSKLRNGDGFWDPAAKQPVPAVVATLREIRPGMLRYPGGSMANNFDWRKAVGPVEGRGDWQFGIDEYITLCRAANAEPLFTLSDYVLPGPEMPQHNAELIEYLDAPATPDHPWALKRKEWGHAEPYGVKYFELGNESNTGNSNVVPHRQYSPEEYAAYAVDTIKLGHAIDPALQFGIVTAILTPDVDCEWNLTVFRLAGPAAGFVVVHHYSPRAPQEMPIEQEGLLMQSTMAEADQYEGRLQDYHEVIKRVVGHDLPLAITEYNIGVKSRKLKSYRYSMGAGLECGDLMRVFMKPENNVLTAVYQNYLNGFWGMVRDAAGKTPKGGLEKKSAFFYYSLWGRHFGARLVHEEVAGPTATFTGLADTLPAQGAARMISQPLGPVSLKQKDLARLSGKNYAFSLLPGGGFAIDLKDYDGSDNPYLGDVIPPPSKSVADCDYSLSFEARYLPADEPGTEVMPLGLEIADVRGYETTAAVVQVRGINQPEWKTFQSGALHIMPDAPGVKVVTMLQVRPHKISGRLEVRNLKITALSKPSFPAYALVTSASSLSADGKTLYVVVFNKSETQDIAGTVQMAGFDAASAKYWEVNGPELVALDGVSEVVSGQDVPVSGAQAQHLFPAHSMTAIEFQR